MAEAGVLSVVQAEKELAFDDLLLPLVQPGYRLACAMLHDPQAAEDVVQEASITAWRKLRGLPDRTRLRAWFLGIVANECRNARRKRWRTRVSIGLPGRLSVGSPEDAAATGIDLRKALMSLDYGDRLIVSLYFYLDLPLNEVAAVAGCSEPAARAKLYRAVHRLRPNVALEEALR
ncbi:MAG TPA: RNA polymerase sigma factor [Candidatus Udaeobacter sp.]|nr:RNA polymerase sigma factor [Candidatus Udaeobacter sp.]